MRFGLIHEGATPHGLTYHRRYKETIEEVVLAEEMGFDFWGTSEQHFLVDQGISATEVLYGAVAAHTSRIRLRHMIRLLLTFNHPVRIAEQLATLDIVSDGRAELGTGRANTLLQLEGFEVNPKETRAQWNEALDVIVKAFTQDPFEHYGHYWNIPPRSLTPKPLQYPHPPLSVAATSFEMHRIAGEKGIGAMSFENYLGWDYLHQCIELYQSSIVKAKPVGRYVNNCLSFLVLPAHCAETMEQAKAEGGPTTLSFLEAVIHIYQELAKTSPDYAYMGRITEIEEHKHDLDYMLAASPGIMLGTPDYFVERIKELEELGFDEVILRLDGMQGHEKIMKSIRLIGDYVIPEFKSPHCVVRRSLFEGGVP